MGNGLAVHEAMSGLPSAAARRRSSVRLAAVAGALVAVGAILGATWSVSWFQGGQTIEVAMVARHLKFNQTNPRIEMKLGDILKLALTNAEPAGIPHDLVIAGPAGITSQPLAPGETQVLTFKPSQPGVYHYSCSLHPRLMDGAIVVRP